MLRIPRKPARLAAVAGLGLLSTAAAAEEAPTPTSAPETPPAITTPAPSPASTSGSTEPAVAVQSPSAHSTPPVTAQPNPLEDRVRELEETVRQLRSTLETVQKQQQAKPADTAQVEKIVDDKLKKQKPLVGWQNGFFLESPDANFRLRVRAQIQTDMRAFIGRGTTGTDSFFLRRARPIIEGTVYKHFDFRIMPDFGGGTTTLFDAYLDYHQFRQATLRVGKFKEPVSLERLQGAPDLHFIERSIAQNLAPNRDVGIQLSGELFKNTLTYYAAAFNGVNDGGSTDGDVDSDKDFAGRLFYEPFKNRPKFALQGLGFGFGASVGERDEPLSAAFRTAGRSAFFRYRGGAAPAAGAGTHTRFFPGFYYFHGPLGLMGEYMRTEQEVERLGVRDRIKNDGYFLQATYVLTGERGAFRGVTPRRDFDPSKGHWGAFEIGARYSRLNLDQSLFRRDFADAAAVTGGADEFTFGLNWYLNRAVKIQLNYVRTNFDGATPFGGESRDHEDVFLSRFQVAF